MKMKNPYSHEHSVRVTEPSRHRYVRFRRVNDMLGKGVHAIVGILRKAVGKAKTEVQAVRFDARKFSLSQARKWVDAHGGRGLKIEPATGDVVGEVYRGNPMRHSATKIKMFGTHNDTDKWVVAVDGWFGLFSTLKQANTAYDIVGGDEGSDGLAETPFGSAQIMPPHHIIKFRDGYAPDGGFDYISKHKPIDIVGYIRKQWTKMKSYSPTTELKTAKQRLEQKIFMKQFFGNNPMSSMDLAAWLEAAYHEEKKGIIEYEKLYQKISGAAPEYAGVRRVLKRIIKDEKHHVANLTKLLKF